MSKAGLTRKKIKVRSKSGKTFQRSVMVRAEAIGKRASGKKLNSLNPWETRHVEGVSTNTQLGERQKAYGSSGPGSSHSWLAIAVGAAKRQNAWKYQHDIPDHADSASDMARARRMAGSTALPVVSDHMRRQLRTNQRNDMHAMYGALTPPTHSKAGVIERSLVIPEGRRVGWAAQDLHHHLTNTYGRSNVEQVPNNPWKHVVR